MMNHQLYFFGGKGGTGKTSLSSAWALKLSQEGKKVLAVSTDPAHSLADAFHLTLSDTPTALSPTLDAVEIDSSKDAQEYVDSIKEKLCSVVSPAIVGDIERQLDLSAASPGSEESALLDRFSQLMELAGTQYDAIVFDTAPTGHTLRLLELPSMLGLWMNHLAAKRQKAMDLMKLASKYEQDLQTKMAQEDPLLAILNRRKEQFAKAKANLTDSSRTRFFCVMTPETLPLLETRRAVEKLTKFHIPLGKILINRVLPEESGPYFQKLRGHQQQIIQQATSDFQRHGIVQIPWLDKDINGQGDLQRLIPYLNDL